MLKNVFKTLSNRHDFGSLSSADLVDKHLDSLAIAWKIYQIERLKMELVFSKSVAKELGNIIAHVRNTYPNANECDNFGVQPHWVDTLVEDLERELAKVNKNIQLIEKELK